MGWKHLQNVGDLDGIVAASHSRPQLVLKHSTRCSISAAAKHRFDSDLYALGLAMDLHYLDLLVHRDVSNAVAEKTGIRHESPQALLIIGGEVAYHDSHYGIDPEAVRQLAMAHNTAQAEG